ncbi:MAG: hypothetical protein FWB90_10595, partial [Fibromonadales bacterium]|nr:hypothetical protein [Fibromonadales bacterium]
MDSKKLPLWKMALLANPDSFGVMPADFTPKLPPQNGKNNKIAENEENTEEKLTFYYTAIKTQQCIDEYLSFSEGIATAYFRISENKDEKIFLQGNAFLSKAAKAVFEKDEKLFIEACETHKDENYFLECAKALEMLGFMLEGSEISKNSWLDLYKAVLLLTEEYLSTKCELPSVEVVEIEENSSDLKIIFASDDKHLNDATLLPLESVSCSSDFLAIGATFFDFLNEKMPNDMIFLEKVCPLPIPDFFATAIMKANKFGAYKDKKIYINHRLALDSLRNPTARFILLLAMLHEYGHFLDDALHEREGMTGGDSEGEEGKAFACKFVENLLDSDFKFADFVAPNPKGEELRFDINISNLTFEEKKGILSIFEYSEALEDGNLQLPSGETIESAEFFGLANMPGIANKAYNAVNKTHQNLTITGAKAEKVESNQYLTDGSIWPDFPTTDPLNTDIPYALKVLASGKDSS